MTKISRQEVLKIAQMTHIDLSGNEVDQVMEQLEQVLSYAERVKECAQDVEEPSIKNINMFREDVVVKTDSSRYIKQAPEYEGRFFVVPIILDSNE